MIFPVEFKVHQYTRYGWMKERVHLLFYHMAWDKDDKLETNLTLGSIPSPF